MTALSTWLRGPGLGTSDRNKTWAAAAFGSAIVVAVPIIFYQGRNQWFSVDEWVYLVDRGVNVHDLMYPHNEHWGAIPVLIYRVLYSMFGIRSYKPYQGVLVGMHVVSAILLRAVMRRAEVAPWIATAVATAFLLFGSGREDILWAFQIHFTGSLAFGLAHLLCADHDGDFDRRDGFGLAFGLASLMCSAIGPVMVGVVGLAVLLRRGPKAAALHVVPLGFVFLTWWWSFGRGGYDTPADMAGALDYAWDGLTNCVVRIGQSPGAGLVLTVALLAGLVLALKPPKSMESLRQWALPLSLAVGALALLLVTGFGRTGRAGNDVPQATRYVYLFGALLFPALASAINELWKHGRVLALIALAALVSGIPGNVRALRATGIEGYLLGSPDMVRTAAHLPALRRLPPERHLFGFLEGPITAGWLQDAADQGKVGPAPKVSAAERANVMLGIVLGRVPGPPQPPCVPLAGRVQRHLQAGQTISFTGSPALISVRFHGADTPYSGRPVNTRYEAQGSPLDLTIYPAKPGADARLCT